MFDNTQILQQEFDKLKIEFAEAYNRKGMRASGKWEEGLETKVQQNSAKLLGLDYTEQLEFGREPGKFPPIKSIEDWIDDKGIEFDVNKITKSSLAFLIARKISKQGWDRKEFGGINLVSEVLTPTRIQKILDRVSVFNLGEFQSGVIKILKEIAK